MDDLISRQAAIDAVKKNTFRLTFAEEQNCEGHVAWSAEAVYSDVMEGALLDLPSVQPDHVADTGKKFCVDTISRQAALDAIMGQPPEPHYPSWYAAQIEKLPAVQPATNCSEIPNGSDDTISRRAAIDAMKDMYRAAEKWLRDATDDVTKARAESCMASLVEIKLRTEKLPSVQPDHVADIGKKVSISCAHENDCISRQAAIDAVIDEFKRSPTPAIRAKLRLEALPSAAPSTAHTTETTAPSTDDWIPVERELPEDLAEVNVTWVNHEPEPYYEPIKSKPFTASAVYYEGNWYWYSSVCADVLGEYGRNDVDKVDDTIEITAWMPLPEPYRGGEKET